jgi:phage repressor protein C with HTH and peptisase S24 domain
MLEIHPRLWEKSNMANGEFPRGRALYDRLMALKPSDLPATRWAEEAGVNRGFFSNLKSDRKSASIRSDNLDKILSYIGKSAADLISVEVHPPSNAEPVAFEGQSMERARGDCPVFGTALGAERVIDGEAVEQTMLNTGEVIEYRKRPAITNGVERVYGLYVQGSSMYPAHRDGAFLFAQHDAPLRVGDDVVVYLRPLDASDDGTTARCVLVKRLVKRTAQYVELEQFTPAKVFRIPMVDVLRIDRVLTADDYA